MESFSAIVKKELSRFPVRKKCCAQAECYGALLLGSAFRAGELRIVTSHAAFAARLPALFAEGFSIQAASIVS